MATRQLASPRVPRSGRTLARWVGHSRAGAALPAGIGAALLATILYSAFARGAVARATDTRIELIVTGLAVLAALGWAWLGTVRWHAPRPTLIGAGLLIAYAAWSGLSVLWSISPDQSWIEVNRVVTYVLVAGLGVLIAASYDRAVELVAGGFAMVALIVALYALGEKVLPGLYPSGVFNVGQGGSTPRLEDPLGYWNALALFLVMAAPAALALAVDRTRTATARVLAACAMALMVITVPLTYSRGGLIALAVAVAVGIGLGRERLRSAIWLVAIVVASLPAVLLGQLMHQLNTGDLRLGTREWAGGVLAAAIIAGLAVLVLAGRGIIAREPAMVLSPAAQSSLRRGLRAGLAVLVVAGLVGLAVSNRGFTGEISNIWNGFAGNKSASNYNPQRLLSTDSYRWVWWKEAAAAFSDRPLQGWGAGSFPVLHLLYRRNTLPVQQPHSVPLQFLAETGLIGALLGIGAFVLLAVGATRAVRSRPEGSERLLAAALLAASLAYGIHCFYDWDWNIAALSLPAFLFLGVLAGRWAAPRSDSSQRRADGGEWFRRGAGLRALALAAATLWLCAFAVSVELPELAASNASAALVAASSSSPAAIRSAHSEAALASQLDPLSDAGLEAEAELAVRESRDRLAQVLMTEAVARDPTDPLAWRFLANVDYYALRDSAAAFMAFQRSIDLDPMGSFAQSVVRGNLHRAPPVASATRIPTPRS